MRKFLQIFISLSFILCVSGVLMAQTDLRINKTEKLNIDREALLKNRQSLQIIDIQQVDKASFADRESSQLKDKKAVNNISALSSPEVNAHHRYKSIPVADKVKLSDKNVLPALAPPAEDDPLYSITAEACEQITSADGIGSYRGFIDLADDLLVPAGQNFSLETFEVFFLNHGNPQLGYYFGFLYDDCASGPGEEMDLNYLLDDIYWWNYGEVEPGILLQ